MNHVTVLVPTRDRWTKLVTMLQSLPLSAPYCTAVVVCDDDPDTYRKIGHAFPQVERFLMQPHAGSVACRNHYAPRTKDGLLYAVDDVVFVDDIIPCLIEEFNNVFGDDDGVLGLQQRQPHHPSGMALMGKAFLDRYPGRRPFFSQYRHFAAQEVMWLAQDVGKWAYSNQISVDHFGAQHYRDAVDATHFEARIHKQQDMALIEQRVAQGLIWGKDEQ